MVTCNWLYGRANEAKVYCINQYTLNVIMQVMHVLSYITPNINIIIIIVVSINAYVH